MKLRTFIKLTMLAGLLAGTLCMAADELDRSNVVWESPSKDSLGSMPLGNGDIGLNVWCEENGDLLFYISKVDAHMSYNTLPKMGRVRIHLTPNPFAAGQPFRQELVLRDGAIVISAGKGQEKVLLRLWVDANHPCIHVSGEGAAPLEAQVSLESVRDRIRGLAEPAATLPDDKAARLVWAFRNESSSYNERSLGKSDALAKTFVDPLLHRTSGGLIQATGGERVKPDALQVKAQDGKLDISIQVLSCQTEKMADWFALIEQQATEAGRRDVGQDFSAHQAWWSAFWNRSSITVGGCGAGPVRLDGYLFARYPLAIDAYCRGLVLDSGTNAFQLTQRYALERFVQACASRTQEVPMPYNGSIFTMDMPAGTHGFVPKGTRPNAVNADYRDWGRNLFMWQNTRHPYWSMLARGDYDTMMPVFRLVRGSLEVGRDRCRRLFGHDGAFMPEAMLPKGFCLFGDELPVHLRSHFVGTIEMTAMMCDYYAQTQDRAFAQEYLLPCADEFLRFFELHFPKRDEHGKMVMEPAGVAETYQPVTDPVTEVSGLRYALDKLLAMDESLVSGERRARWAKLREAMPEVPRRTILGMDLLAPGWKYKGRLICETPELYAVWPFRQVAVENDGFLADARQSFHVRQLSLDGTQDVQSWETGGWQSAPIWAAHLGLPREAARLTSINFDDRLPNFTYGIMDMVPPDPAHPRPRFPAFWETKMDYTPDVDHGAVSATALESMLLQSDANKIYLLPAWPEDWDVSFKLHAARQTTVECVYRGGRIQSLKVTPVSRRADIVDGSSLQNRVHNLVSVACADRNYLFGLPPMLDGRVVPEDADRLKTTGAWLAKYGESLYGTRSGPFAPAGWGGSVFKENTVYLHILNWPKEPIQLQGIGRKLVRWQCLGGQKVQVAGSESGFAVSLTKGKPDPCDTVVRLDFDDSVEPAALAAHYKGSLTTGGKVTASSFMPGFEPGNATDANPKTAWKPNGGGWIEIDLGRPVTFDRMELEFDDPAHVRGQFKAFQVEYKQPDGTYKAWQNGLIYGEIYSRRFEPVTAQIVRLSINSAAPVRQFDLFGPGK